MRQDIWRQEVESRLQTSSDSVSDVEATKFATMRFYGNEMLVTILMSHQ